MDRGSGDITLDGGRGLGPGEDPEVVRCRGREVALGDQLEVVMSSGWVEVDSQNCCCGSGPSAGLSPGEHLEGVRGARAWSQVNGTKWSSGWAGGDP